MCCYRKVKTATVKSKWSERLKLHGSFYSPLSNDRGSQTVCFVMWISFFPSLLHISHCVISAPKQVSNCWKAAKGLLQLQRLPPPPTRGGAAPFHPADFTLSTNLPLAMVWCCLAGRLVGWLKRQQEFSEVWGQTPSLLIERVVTEREREIERVGKTEKERKKVASSWNRHCQTISQQLRETEVGVFCRGVWKSLNLLVCEHLSRCHWESFGLFPNGCIFFDRWW